MFPIFWWCGISEVHDSESRTSTTLCLDHQQSHMSFQVVRIKMGQNGHEKNDMLLRNLRSSALS